MKMTLVKINFMKFKVSELRSEEVFESKHYVVTKSPHSRKILHCEHSSLRSLRHIRRIIGKDY